MSSAVHAKRKDTFFFQDRKEEKRQRYATQQGSFSTEKQQLIIQFPTKITHAVENDPLLQIESSDY